jgi:gas vesicle protein
MRGHRHTDNKDKLQELVDSGDITADQKKLIEQKQQELEDARDAIKDELEQWAEDNDIDQKYLMFGGHGMRGGSGRPDGGRF